MMKVDRARLIGFVFVLVAADVTLTIDADVYKVSDQPSRRFDGIGGLSGGGATSKLLVSYKEPQRSQILDLLFKPGYGAALNILKVEIGGDSQSTDGSESSHMHEENDENYQRGYEWWLMKEAKKRNANIVLSALSWAFPGWIGEGTQSPYKNRTKLTEYTLKWIKGAKDVHNLTIDYIGIWNELQCDNDYILLLRKALDKNGFHHVKIVAPDGWVNSGSFKQYARNRTLFDAIDVIGVHYPGTYMAEDARMNGKTLWASEDYSTNSNDIGAGCWARILNQNYVNGNLTSTIAWNLIASYYKGLPFAGDGLMSAMHPWSGHYDVRNTIWVTAHTTHFASAGWHYLYQGSGAGKLAHGGSFVGLTNGTDLTIVIETMTHDKSLCIRPRLPPYNVTKQTVVFQLENLFKKLTKFHHFVTRFGTTDVVFEKQEDIQIKNNRVELNLDVDSVHTLSTVDSTGRISPAHIPDAKPFPLPYSDNFDDYAVDAEPKYLTQQNGAWEVVKEGGEGAEGQQRGGQGQGQQGGGQGQQGGGQGQQGGGQGQERGGQGQERRQGQGQKGQGQEGQGQKGQGQEGQGQKGGQGQEGQGQRQQGEGGQGQRQGQGQGQEGQRQGQEGQGQRQGFVRQKVRQSPVHWCWQLKALPVIVAIIGNTQWRNVSMSVKFRALENQQTEAFFVALRSDAWSCGLLNGQGIYFWVQPNSTTFWISLDIASLDIIKIGTLNSPVKYNQWHAMALSVNENLLTASIDSNDIVTMELKDKTATSGFVAMGTRGYGLSDWDDLHISSVPQMPQSESHFLEKFYRHILEIISAFLIAPPL